MADSMKTLPHSWIEEESNRVDTLTAVCRRKYAWNTGQHDELEIGKTYKVTHIDPIGRIWFEDVQHSLVRPL